MKMKKYFNVIKNETTNVHDLHFYGDIVNTDWDKWDDSDKTAEDVRTFLSEVGANDSLNIYINSGGGSVFTGIAIYNMLKRHKGMKTVHVDALAASIASVIMFAGDKVIIPANSMTMIHKAWSWAIGNSNDMRKMADDLDRIETAIHAVYEENLADGVDIETIKQMMEAETWLNGKEAAKYFKVEIGEESKIAACISSDYYKNYRNMPSLTIVDESIVDKTVDDSLEIEKLKLQLELL